MKAEDTPGIGAIVGAAIRRAASSAEGGVPAIVAAASLI
jgi:hypothetical protein